MSESAGAASASGVASSESPTQPKRADESLGELLSEVTTELGDLFRKEIELAKVEGKEEASKLAQAAAAFGAGAVAALLLLIFASTALMWLLDEWMHLALAALVVAILWAIVAAIAVAAGRKRMKQVQPMPETARSLKEDAQWAKTLKN
ncbi:MAG: phage holin family protein [Actinomycetota bacterium]|nr:phage holin family protein [Actinomycetota bacterium]